MGSCFNIFGISSARPSQSRPLFSLLNTVTNIVYFMNSVGLQTCYSRTSYALVMRYATNQDSWVSCLAQTGFITFGEGVHSLVGPLPCAGAQRIFKQSVGTPGLGSRLSTYWPTKWPKKLWCNQHTSTDQTHTPCVPVSSPGFKPKGKAWRAGALKPDKLNLAWAAKPINAMAPGLETSVC